MDYLVPPLNYGMVIDGLYRSAEPYSLNFPFIKSLNLKSVVYLPSSNPNQEFLSFMTDNEIEFIHVGKTGKDYNPISREFIENALKVVLNKENYPILLCCRLGRHKTGTVVGVLRKILGWNLTSIFDEYNRHSNNKTVIKNQHFIELFEISEIAVPQWVKEDDLY